MSVACVRGEHRGTGEAVADDGVAECERDDLGDVGGDAREHTGIGQRAQLGDAGPDRATQQPVPGDLVVDAQQLLAHPLGVGVEDRVGDVVAQRADVAHVVVEPFELEQYGPPSPDVLGHDLAAGVLDRLAEGQRVARRRCRR